MRHRYAPRGAALALLLTSTLAAAGCDGRVFPVDAAAEGEGPDVSLEYERVRDRTAPEGGARFEAEIEGLALRGATLALPDGSVLPFAEEEPEEGEAGPRFVLSAESPEAVLLRRFPPGSYTIEMTRESGARRELRAVVSGGFPDFPDVIEPAEGALSVPIDGRFIWTGPDALYDLVVVNELTGERREIADAIEGFEALAREPLEPATPYRLELSAESIGPGGMVEFESTSVVRFVTE